MLGKLKISSPTVVNEGAETDRFWKALGGKEKYADHPMLQQDFSEYPARLFVISDATGNWRISKFCFGN